VSAYAGRCGASTRRGASPWGVAHTLRGMAFTVKELREAQDDVLIALHDRLAVNTVPGVNYYLDELKRRDQARAIQASHRLAVASFVLSSVNAVVAIVAVVIAVAA
jgi:hypothetical protein